MRHQTEPDKVCVIGAGPSGLATAKVFAERGIPFDLLEREDDIGGLWNPATNAGVVYSTAHLLSSRAHTGFEDFPMPEHYPIYPSHGQALAYFRSYAAHFDLMPHIQLGAAVDRAERAVGRWSVKVAGEAAPRFYRALVVASGHHDEPRMPKIPGEFAGEMLHSRHYRSPEQLVGKRVIVVGAGNSGCDIVIDATNFADSVAHSMRRGAYFVPKFMFGFPTDSFVNITDRIPMPFGLRDRLYTLWHRILFGAHARYGLEPPEHGILQSHPTMNSVLPQLIAHGRIALKPDIATVSGKSVRFSDGSTTEADLIIFATGYESGVPYLDPSVLFLADGRPRLFLNSFDPDSDDLFAVGLIQANGSIWRIADLQARLVASYLVALAQAPDRAAWFSALKAEGGVRRWNRHHVASPRHRLEANYHLYTSELKRLLRRFGRIASASLRTHRLATTRSSREPIEAHAGR